MILLFGVPMFVGGCAILWIYWDRLKKSQKKKIFISADCWLCVFDLLEPSQLGLGISMISHRFDIYVDEHFKNRKWFIRIRGKIGENGTKEMEIVKIYHGKSLPIPQVQLQRKVIGFKRIIISYFDQNVIAFLHRFRSLFAACPINLFINTDSDRILASILRNIWPIFGKRIHGMRLSTNFFRRLRHFVPSFLNDCPSLRVVSIYYNDFTELPADNSANASNGQAVAKWLFTPLQDDVPKVLKCYLDTDDGIFASRMEAFKAAFASASSSVNFIVVIWFPFSDFVPFDLINGFTHEQLALKSINNNSNRFLLIRCPIARDESKWTKWEEEAIDGRIDKPWNRIDIYIDREDNIGDGLLDTTPGPSDQQLT